MERPLSPSQAPRVSVVIPVFNGEAFAATAIESVRSQTFPDCEIIVVDDGSTDKTGEVCRPYAEKGQILYLQKENGGVSTARNAGIKAARGEYVAFLDADDELLPESLERRIAALDAYPEAGLVFTNFHVNEDPLSSHPSGIRLQEREREILASVTSKRSGDSCLLGNGYMKAALATPRIFPFVSAVMVRKSCLEHTGTFNEAFRHAEDTDLWMRMALSCTFVYVDEVICIYNKNIGTEHRASQHVWANRIRSLKQVQADGPPELRPLAGKWIGSTRFGLGLLLLQRGERARALFHLAGSLAHVHPYVWAGKKMQSAFSRKEKSEAGQILQRMHYYLKLVLGMDKPSKGKG